MAVRFNAASEQLSYTTSSPPDPQAGFTATMWAYLSATTGASATMLRLYTVSGDSTRLTFSTDASTGLTPNIFTSGNTGGVAAGDAFTVGSWLKLAITQTGTTATLWSAKIGGATHSNSGTASGGSTATGLSYGGRSTVDSTEWWNGRIAYARIWSAVLTQTQIETEWASASAQHATNLWADYPLPATTDITDHSSGAHNLSAGSSSTTTEANPPPFIYAPPHFVVAQAIPRAATR